MPSKRKKRALTILVVIIIVAVAITYILPVALLGASAAETGDPNAPAQGNEEFGTDDPAVIPPNIPEPPKPPASLLITYYPPTMEVGDQGQLVCELMNAPEGTYAEWASSNSAVVVVDPTGSIVAIAPGDAEITVRAGDLRSSALVHVNDYKASKITILAAGLTGEPNLQGRVVYKVKVGDVCHLSPQIEPKGAKLERLTWTVSDPAVAELSEDGDFIARAKGSISVTAASGVLSDTIFFEIEESGIPVNTILRYIIIGAIVIVVIVVIAVLAANAAKQHKEAERKRAAAAKRRKEEARQREEEAAKQAAEDAAIAAMIERNKHVPEPEPAAERPAKVSGATVSASGDAAKPREGEAERPLTLDDVE